MRSPTALEAIAIQLHDHLWENMGVSDDWLIQLGGDDEAVTKMIRLMNELQEEIKASGISHQHYCRYLP